MQLTSIEGGIRVTTAETENDTLTIGGWGVEEGVKDNAKTTPQFILLITTKTPSALIDPLT